ncbi:phosphatidylinositol binding [Basidiobolus ranarum]|uniref:Phosphatidylinositol binding n=1 Tax=Basidiobolus ranarum TaxID=34480 RepID=A0ABR2WQK3_9FUNG
MSKFEADQLLEGKEARESTREEWEKVETPSRDSLLFLRAWLPSPLSNLTITQITLLALFLLFLLASRVQLSVFTLFSGFIFGYIYAVPSNEILSSPFISKFNIFYSGKPIGVIQKEESELLVQPVISLQIDSSLNRLFDYIVRDFVRYWFEPLNLSKSPEFESRVRESLSITASNFSLYARRDNVDLSLLLIYALANTLIVHVREYRQFEASALPLDKYLSENPQSPFNQSYYDNLSQMTQLQKLSKILLTKLLPKQDTLSPCLMALLTEISTTSTIVPTLEALSDPDRINQLIISILKNAEKKRSPSNNDKQKKEYERLKACGDEVLRVKVIEARQIYHTGSYGLYCTIYSGKAKCKTKFVKPESNPLWVETFNFSWCKSPGKGIDGVDLELCGRVMFPKDITIGKICVSRKEISAKKSTRTWFPLQPISSKYEICGEVLLEIDIIDVNEMASTEVSKENTIMDESDENFILENPLSLDDVLRSNNGFIEFMQFMEDIQAPPFLQFWMNVESFLETSRQSSPELMIQDAEMIYKLHLSDEAKRKVPIDPVILGNIIKELGSTHVTSDCFVEAQAYVFDVMESPFFREFRYSDYFRKYCLDTRFAEHKQDSDVRGRLQHCMDSIPPASTQESATEPLLSDRVSSELPSAQSPNGSDSDSFVSTESNGLNYDESNDTSKVRTSDDHPLRRSNSIPSFPTLNNVESGKVDDASRIENIGSSQENSKRSRSMSDITATHAARNQIRRFTFNPNSLSKVDESNPPEESTSEENGGGMKNLTAAITTLREQLAVTNDLIEQTPSKESSKLKSLNHNRDELQRQVNQLVEMARDFAKEEDNHIGTKLIDLKGILAKVSDASRPAASLGPNLVKSLASGKAVLFVIELERTKSSGGWMITRSFADFTQLHTALREQFPKVDKIKFPSRQRFISKANNHKLCVELERYLALLLSDMLLCESKPLQIFLKPDSVADHGNRDLGDGMLEAFKSAANLVKLPFVDTQKVNILRSKTKVPSPTSIRSSNEESLSSRNTSLELSSHSDELGLTKPAPSYNKNCSNPSWLASLSDEASLDPSANFETISSNRGNNTGATKPLSEGIPQLVTINSNHTNSQSTHEEENPDDILLSSNNRQSQAPTNSVNPLNDIHQEHLASHRRHNSVLSIESEKSVLKDLSTDEVDVLIETFFALVEEMFDMTERKQWLRRKALNVLKQILRQSYGKTINRAFLEYLEKATSEDNIVYAIDTLTNSLWPGGEWPREWPKPRTEEEKQATKIEAKVLFVNNMPDTIFRMVGDYNAALGLTRLFNMLQYSELTKGLLIKILEAWVKLVFNENEQQ